MASMKGVVRAKSEDRTEDEITANMMIILTIFQAQFTFLLTILPNSR